METSYFNFTKLVRLINDLPMHYNFLYKIPRISNYIEVDVKDFTNSSLFELKFFQVYIYAQNNQGILSACASSKSNIRYI